MCDMRPIAFRNAEGDKLQGLFCSGRGEAACVILCFPFADERKQSVRAYMQVARVLGQRGLASMLFDYSGCGNSEGEFQNATFDVWARDTLCAYDYAKSLRYSKIMALGVRLGANIVLEAQATRPVFEYILMWNLIADTWRYLQAEKRRTRLLSMLSAKRRGPSCAQDPDGEIVDLSGYHCGLGLLKSFKSHYPEDLLRRIDNGVVESAVVVSRDSAEAGMYADGTAPRLRVQSQSFWYMPDASGLDGFAEATAELCERRLA